jgi:hypothetical protein
VFAFLKAVALGIILTLVVAYIIGSAGSSAGILNVRGVTVNDIHFFWSWGLFLVGTGISFGILWMME